MSGLRRRVVLAVVLCGSVAAAGARADGVCCGDPCAVPTFAYGNAGFAAGFSTSCSSWGWGWAPRWRDRCGCRWAACGPRWGCLPWYGATTWGFSESVFLSVPAGGGATFFSGALVPYPFWGGWGYPATWVPGWYGVPYGVTVPSGIAPQFGPAGVLPFLGCSAATAHPTAGAMVSNGPAATGAARPMIPLVRSGGRPVTVQASTSVTRLRAARLVATGDRHLRRAQGDPRRLAAALDAYRRAAAVAQDQPDIHLRQALALVALDRQGQADEAVGRAVALDGRLAAEAVLPAAGLQDAAPPDPVFGDRPRGGPPPFAVRGAAILREIAAQAAGDKGGPEVVTLLADRWSRRFDRGLDAIAAHPAAGR